ncbi:mitochondrial chaperone Frataxin [Xylaria nigripes]|nr:mitochondrial chaperone Frataxin [Xylaria nigripes]
MLRSSTTRLAGIVMRSVAARSVTAGSTRLLVASRPQVVNTRPTIQSLFSTSQRLAKLFPDDLRSACPANITVTEFHELADNFIMRLVAKTENMQDTQTSIEVEYSAGIVLLKIDSIGTYVICKRPSSRQIWLSSPISGAKCFDWTIVREGQQHKQDTASAKFVFLRDGTLLTELLLVETGIAIDGPK